MPPLLIGIGIAAVASVAYSTFVPLILIAASIALQLASSLLFPRPQPQQQRLQAPDLPRPADGKFAQKQNVPSLIVALGKVKLAGDFAFLEEKNGTAYSIFVVAAHRIEGFVSHWLHDKQATLDGSGYVTAPAHFNSKVNITTQLGLAAETAKWDDIFPSIWSEDHRGDGLAKVFMTAATVDQASFQTVYPQGMPVLSSVIEGARVYDPREGGHDPDDPDTWEYSENLALLRLFHLTDPSGGKLSIADLHLPDWIAAADVCDETVLNRDGYSEPRYHGGLWYRHNSDPVTVGRALDEAADLVLYERPDGLIGVHAGAFTTPDIRITRNDILECTYSANRSAAATVLAVRGRWTDPETLYNTVDAAIWGDPYGGDDGSQRSKTIDNQAVQRHNHIQRLQKLSFTRANAPRVALTIPYLGDADSRNVPYRRFVTVHYPERGLDEAVLELIGRPKLDLARLTLAFEGIVVPATLYDFDAEEEEGEPPPTLDTVADAGVPVPTGFAINMGTETLVGGAAAVFALADWDHVSDTFTYELEYQLDDLSEPPRTVTSQPGSDSVRTIVLQDGADYRFRLRTLSNGAVSAWTSDIVETAQADLVPPADPTSFTVSPSGSLPGGLGPGISVGWVQPNSPNLYRSELYRAESSTDFDDATLLYTSYAAGGVTTGYQDPESGTVVSGLDYSYWLRAFNASNVGGTLLGPETATAP